jgi:ApaG protein
MDELWPPSGTDGSASEATTRGIRVRARSFYVPERSSRAENYYFFAYRVQISNLGDETAQLVSRTWIITDGDGEEQRVNGPGVVGEQPVLTPGGTFEYTSFCPLRTLVGSMEGSYQMISAEGEHFDAEIAAFTLAVPHAVN